MAVRYKAMFPKLKIGAVADRASAVSLDRSAPTVIIGCVDNAAARMSIEELTIEYSGLVAHGFSHIPCWWIDCGNDYTYGQVAIGNHDYILEPATCTTLPVPLYLYQPFNIPNCCYKPMTMKLYPARNELC